VEVYLVHRKSVPNVVAADHADLGVAKHHRSMDLCQRLACALQTGGSYLELLEHLGTWLRLGAWKLVDRDDSFANHLHP
jgi:hypothetical protein